MGRSEGNRQPLARQRLFEYLKRRFAARTLLKVSPLGEEGHTDLKAYGYGRPLRLDFLDEEGETRSVVLRSMAPDPFGHDRRADRIAALYQAYDSFGKTPKHIRALDVGQIDDQGRLHSASPGEPFLVSDYVEGKLYADDLRAMRLGESADALGVQRARALADYLAMLHGRRAPSDQYPRAVRDLLGSGEGIMGICDAYPVDDQLAPPERLTALETKALRWRWMLKASGDRCCRTHGDFHPFNLLFRDGVDLSVLDCSRGGVGDAADDLTCLSINYLFFSLLAIRSDGQACRQEHVDRSRLVEPYRTLWQTFWGRYLSRREDQRVLQRVAPFFAWRALVLACPTWYPGLDSKVRDCLLVFAERLLDGAPFVPERVDELLKH